MTKFREYSAKHCESYPVKIIELASACGVTNLPDQIQCKIVSRFLISQFPSLSHQEVEKAIILKASGKLENVKDHYNDFSMEFIGSLCKSYRSYRNKHLAKYEREKAKKEEKPEPTQEQKDVIRQQYLETVFYKPYKKSMENGIDFYVDEQVAVDLFRKIFIEGEKSVSPDVLQKYNTKAKEWLRTPRTEKIKKSELVKIWNDLDCLNAIDQGHDIQSDPDLRKMAAKIKKVACWLFFVDWVNQQIELGIDCETII